MMGKTTLDFLIAIHILKAVWIFFPVFLLELRYC